MTRDPLLELHALAVLDVLDAAQAVVDDWQCKQSVSFGHLVDLLDGALARLDRFEVVESAAA